MPLFPGRLALLLFSALIITTTQCKFPRKEKPVSLEQNKPTPAMPIQTPPGDYATAWKTIDSLEQQGLFKSALEAVEKLGERAKKDGKQAQHIKTILFRGKYTTMLEDEGFVRAVETMEKEAATAVQPQKAVMQSMLGELYATYLSNQSWNIRQRTPIDDGEGNNLLTWSGRRIEQQAADHYLASVEPRDLLLKVPVEQFDAVTTPSKGDSLAGVPFRPTLFDFLAHRAIAYFTNERSFLNEPVYAFEMDQSEAFAPVETFVKTTFTTRDSASGKWQALRLFQQVLAHHLTDKDPAALVDADLLRLQFAKSNSVLHDKDLYYQAALEDLLGKTFRHPINPEVAHALARHFIDQYYANPADDDLRYNFKRAYTLCDEATKRHPNTPGAAMCRQTMRELNTPSIQSKIEEVNLPGEAILVSVPFRNVKGLFMRVVKLPTDPGFLDTLTWEKRPDYFRSLPAVQNRTWNLPDPGDYREHTTEIALDALPLGSWMVLLSNVPDFDPARGVLTYAPFAVSNLAPVQFRENGRVRFAVANRQTGAPLANVQTTSFERKYDYSNNRQEYRQVGQKMTDRDGLVTPDVNENQSVQLRFNIGADTLWGQEFYNNYRQQKQRPSRQVHFFTDRSLYRPGQTVYFKGVLFDRDTDQMPEIVENESVEVVFLDANNQEKGRLKLRSNKFGTFNGAFTAPAAGLTGMMSIRAENLRGIASFNVEEYKRPRFEVTFDPMQGVYRLYDTLTMQGKAANYAGNAVDGAEVRYRVVRRTFFPFRDYYFSKIWPPYGAEEREIARGTTVTRTDGSFDVVFQALPDKGVGRSFKPTFTYVVTADVTDISGETRSAEQSATVGYQAVQIGLELPEELPLDSMKTVRVTSVNWAGQPQPSSGTIGLQRLVEPKMLYRNRYWEKQELPVIDEATWNKMLPNYARLDEDEPKNWGREDFTRQVPFNTADGQTVNLNNGSLRPGYYYVTLESTDKYGETVKLERIVHLYDPANQRTRFRDPAIVLQKQTLEPGEKVVLNYGGQPANLHFFLSSVRDNKLEKPKWYNTPDNGILEETVLERDRGGMAMFGFCVYNNRRYILENGSVNVPWSNKDLDLQYETFRNKLLPGQPETWTLVVSGPKKEKVAAEMVASMYDASLDQFKPHSWQKIGFPSANDQVRVEGLWGANNGEIHYYSGEMMEGVERYYRNMNWFDFPMYGGGRYYMDGVRMLGSRSEPPEMVMMAAPAAAPMKDGAADRMDDDASMKVAGEEVAIPEKPAEGSGIRRNLNETVFFFPELKTDAQGNVRIQFTMNEALTRWKFMTFAHTEDLKQVFSERDVVTQKELMVIPNPPRFLREGDLVTFSAKVSNMTDKPMAGKATLKLMDANTLAPIDAAFANTANDVTFTAAAKQSAPLMWVLKVPADYTGALTWQVFAEAGQHRDGEESTLPVLTNRMLVTETMPMTLRGGQNRTYAFDAMNNKSGTMKPHKFTLEFSSNPAWYAVQSLPYLMEYPHECSEQIFSRFYANTLAHSVTQKMPNLRRVFDSWKGTEAMKSNLSKNQELKSALLEETPWVLEAQSEEQQKQNIALLFDLNRMANERERALSTLAERQAPNGGWSWFPGGRENWYITQYMVEGFGHLKTLGALSMQDDERTTQMVEKALVYCETEAEKQYRELEKQVNAGKAKWDDDHLDNIMIHFLYARSFYKTDAQNSPVIPYYLAQAEKHWLGKGLYQEGLLALALHRHGKKEAAQKIVASLRERALVKDELGMYWPFDWGSYWYQLPIETQALMVEVFDEVAADKKAVEELRIWLLKNKQTNRWNSTKATAQAVYALLLHGDNWLTSTKQVQVTVGNKTLKVPEYEAGTGYFKQQWQGSEIKNNWDNIKVENPNTGPAWGAAYFQYFEDLDNIKAFTNTPLKLKKELYRQENTDKGPVLKAITANDPLKPGDKITVRLEITTDRAMEYVHLKDMRGSGLEPVNVLSGYRWKGTMGYYESTKDLATHFFFDYLPKGTHVLEYTLVANLRGEFSNGISTLQCMYAPEFSAHSKGVRVKIE